MNLRDYQQKAVNSIFDYFKFESGHPLVVAPTGSGKSLIIAGFAKEALQRFKNTHITILAHRKELLQQNSEKILQLWPGAPLGIYSAGLKRRELRQITVAGIGSVYDKAHLFDYQHLLIIDEAHLIPKQGEGMYRTFIEGLMRTNPKLKVIGLTATPYRMDSGMLTDGDDRLFTDVAYDISLRKLINNGYLCGLISKQSAVQADLSDAKIRGGEFVQQDIERIMDDTQLTLAAYKEIQRYGADRKSWIIFCAGVKHTNHVTQLLQQNGVRAAAVTGETDAHDRARILRDFKAGKIQALLNCDVLTTGFDAPNIDMLVLLRPTRSVGLYVQMCGRGCRLFPGKSNCLVLDFAGNIERFGPLDMVKVKRKRSGKAEADTAPTKVCPECEGVISIQLRSCPMCQFEFPAPEREKHGMTATDAPILSKIEEFIVNEVRYSSHEKDKTSLKVEYMCGQQTLQRVQQFVCLEHTGYPRLKARQWWSIHNLDGNNSAIPETTMEALQRINELREPKKIFCAKEGKFWRIINVEFLEPGEARPVFKTEADEVFEKHGLNI